MPPGTAPSAGAEGGVHRLLKPPELARWASQHLGTELPLSVDDESGGIALGGAVGLLDLFVAQQLPVRDPVLPYKVLDLLGRPRIHDHPHHLDPPALVLPPQRRVLRDLLHAGAAPG